MCIVHVAENYANGFGVIDYDASAVENLGY